MTRNEKINKLARAVREYRGVYIVATRKWKRLPKPKAFPRVERWLLALGLDVKSNLHKIERFGTINDFREWVGKL